MVWHGGVDISDYSHDQRVSHTSCTSLVSLFLCVASRGDNADMERVTSAGDLDLPRIFLLSPHHDTRQLPGKLSSFTILNVQNICSSICVRYPVCDLCIFQMSVSCAVHYIWQCPTHPPVPHIVNTVISILISRTGILAVLRSSWEEIIVKVTLNFKCPLWTH